MTADATTLVGIAASVLTAVAMAPQLSKLIKEKEPDGISFIMLGALFLCDLLWVIYGVLKSDWIIVVSNSLSLLINSAIGVLSYVYKRRQKTAS